MLSSEHAGSTLEPVVRRGGFGVDIAAPTARLDAADQALIAAVNGCDGVILAEISVSHPLFGALSLYRRIGISDAHKRRYAAQIEATYRAVDGAGL